MDARTAHALIRFGLGPRGPAPADAGAWLDGQLEGADPLAATDTSASAAGLAALRRQRREKSDAARQAVREIFRAGSAEVFDTLATTDTPFRERLVWFWANHFTVSLRRGEVAAVLHAYVREAIRPHVTGRFADMLRAVMRHPAMLLYLDNALSVGPDSPAGRRSGRGLNENLARECLELHTLSPAGGYTQADVTAFARILTGWSIDLNAPEPGFRFRPFAHQPGPQTLMGRRFDPGERGGEEALAFLAAHPATHRHLAAKLVRHFVADDPPPAAVARIAAVLDGTGGDLKAASRAVTRLPQAWQPLTKLRSPADYVVGVVRALDLPPARRPDMQGVIAGLGQPFFSAPLPNGWPDTGAEWAGPEAMLRRIDWAFAVSARGGGTDPAALAEATLGPLLPADTMAQVARAGSRREGLTLLFASPEFQRR